MSVPIFCNETADCLELDLVTPMLCGEGSICQCSAYHGWVGENCDQVSSFLIYLRVSTVFLSVWNILVIILMLRIIILNFLIVGFTKSFLDLASYSTLLALLFIFPYILHRIYGVFYSHYFEAKATKSILLGNDFVDIDIENAAIFQNFFGLSLFFAGAATFMVVQSWQGIISKVSVYQSFQSGQLAISRRRIFEFVSVLMLGVVGFLFFQQDILLAPLVSGILAIIIAISYAFVSGSFVKSMAFICEQSKGDRILLLTSNFIRKVRTRLIITWICFSVATIYYSFALTSSLTIVSPGKFNYVSMTRDLYLSLLLYQYTVIAWYINSVSAGPIAGETFCPLICLPFKFWDKMNTRLIPEDANCDEDLGYESYLQT